MTNPKLRFPEFFDEWQIVSFDNIFERVTRRNKENNQNILTISAQDGLVSQDKFFSKLVAAKDVTNYYLLYRNDYAYNKSYSKGYPMGAIKRLIHDEKGVISTLYICFRSKGGRSVEFFDQYFESGKLNAEIEKIAQEGARNHGLLNVGIRDFFKMSLIIPSIDERQKITGFLEAIDMRIETIDKKFELLKQYKKDVMQKIFTQKIRFKDEKGNLYPDWENKALGHLFMEREERGDGSRVMLSVTIDKGVIPFTSIDRKDNSSSDKSKYKHVEPGDIAYNSMRMWQGASGLVPVSGMVSPAYTVLKARVGNVPTFWAYYFKLPRVVSTFQRFSQGLTSDTWSLKYKQLSEIKLDVPCTEEQQKIANFLSSLDDRIELENKKLDQAKQFKRFLLQRMFV